MTNTNQNWQLQKGAKPDEMDNLNHRKKTSTSTHYTLFARCMAFWDLPPPSGTFRLLRLDREGSFILWEHSRFLSMVFVKLLTRLSKMKKNGALIYPVYDINIHRHAFLHILHLSKRVCWKFYTYIHWSKGLLLFLFDHRGQNFPGHSLVLVAV